MKGQVQYCLNSQHNRLHAENYRPKKTTGKVESSLTLASRVHFGALEALCTCSSPRAWGQDTLIGFSCGGALEHLQLRRPAFSFSFSAIS